MKCDHLTTRHIGGVLIIVFCLFLPVEAQDKSNSDQNLLHPLHPNQAVVIGVLSIVFSLFFLVVAYAKFCYANQFNFMHQNSSNQNVQELIRSRSRFSGIDRTVIESLPFFRFGSLKGSKEGLECAVCISRFEDTEILRLLPKCRHVFHINCIDQWLESHSSCPLCRYKFDVGELRSFSYSSSLRFLGSNPSNLAEEPNLELFVQREQDHQGSSRFNLGRSCRIRKIEQEELLIQDGNRSVGDQKPLHKFKHKIIISDVVIKKRWSDVNSADLLFLNSEMLSLMSSNRFTRSTSTSARFLNELSVNDNMTKIKEDMERKRLYESKFSELPRSHSISGSSFSSAYYNDANSSKLLTATEKRSLSEITNFARFRDFSIRQKIKEAAFGGDSGKEERVRRLWLPIVQRTVQWFSGREELEHKRQSLNV